MSHRATDCQVDDSAGLGRFTAETKAGPVAESRPTKGRRAIRALLTSGVAAAALAGAVAVAPPASAGTLAWNVNPLQACEEQRPGSNHATSLANVGIGCSVISVSIPWGLTVQAMGSANPWKYCWDHSRAQTRWSWSSGWQCYY